MTVWTYNLEQKKKKIGVLVFNAKKLEYLHPFGPGLGIIIELF